MTNVEATEKAAAVAEQGANVAPEKAPSKKGARRKKNAPKAKKTAKTAAPKKGAKAAKKTSKPEQKTAGPRAESKGAKILEMIGRAKGATLAEIMKATDWQPHSVRGYISIAQKKHSLKIESAKNDAGDRVYTIAR